jgi:hypothetical protein
VKEEVKICAALMIADDLIWLERAAGGVDV